MRRLAAPWLALALALVAPPAGGAEEVVAGLSQARVSIDTDFDGSEILVFGAVKRSAPAPEDPPLEVIVTVAGPSRAVLVRRKERVAGIWVNTKTVRVSSAPSFYAVATTGPLARILDEREDRQYRISIRRAITAISRPAGVEDQPSYVEALMRIRERHDLYQLREGAVRLSEATLFRTAIALPANLTEGRYRTRIYLTRGGVVIDAFRTDIEVRKVGLERWLHALAHREPLLYGLLSLVIAVLSGWSASALFRWIRR